MSGSVSDWWTQNAPPWLGGSNITNFADPGAPLGSGQSEPNLNIDPNAPGWSDQLGKALQDLSKSSLAKPPDSPAAPKPDIPGASSGRPMRPQSLDEIVQLLNKQQAQYGNLTGQPVTRPQYTGLLGF